MFLGGKSISTLRVSRLKQPETLGMASKKILGLQKNLSQSELTPPGATDLLISSELLLVPGFHKSGPFFSLPKNPFLDFGEIWISEKVPNP